MGRHDSCFVSFLIDKQGRRGTRSAVRVLGSIIGREELPPSLNTNKSIPMAIVLVSAQPISSFQMTLGKKHIEVFRLRLYRNRPKMAFLMDSDPLIIWHQFPRQCMQVIVIDYCHLIFPRRR